MADTGPPYPRPPAGIPNGFGQFALGVSPIGDYAPFDVWQTVISQYANSPALTALIGNLFAYLDQTANFDAFFDYIWNVDTAQGYGLDVWGRIVGVNRVLLVTAGDWFGFEGASPGADPFGQGAFYSGAPLTANFALSDEAYRLLILAKAAANITNGSIPAINQILLSLFPNRGNAYITEGSDAGTWFGFQEAINTVGFNQASFYAGSDISTMTMTYTFAFQLTPVELAIVQNSGVLPKPTGVKASVVII
ncbi:DUF2612 domain-containing protein [Mesorhizobium sp. CO1-1-2]|uniref:DUF2612 domain-containing protein n=1 Tax=Mesorhizobium sp. CO1-1-2 TaxID=2876635 RepID=UPI001CCC641D|nr:DUF2612 domain-containing protein [Mesorhizobium sp. CO1-1-2]MBZ9683196.1 DUF2612 domain-containing protein [Mesorhizobium sp. CO1-1-2]